MKKTAPTTPDLTVKVVTPDFGRFMNYLPNPDEVMTQAGQSIRVYREMDTDPRVKSLMDLMKSTIRNIPIRFEQGQASSQVMDFVKENLEGRLDLFVKKFLDALDEGYTVKEVSWREDSGWFLIDDLISWKPERFRITIDGRLKWATQGDQSLLEIPKKWVVYSHDATPENPYGTSRKKACYWPWKFKKAGLEFWLMATERFSVPSLIALFDSSLGEDAVQKKALELSSLLTQVSGGSGAAMGNVKELKALEMNGSLDHFQSLVEFCDTQMAYALAGASLAVAEAKNGTRAQAVVHQDMFYALAASVARELEAPLRQLVAWLVEANFGEKTPAPSVEFDLEEAAPWELVRDAIDRGVPVSKKALYGRYGLPEPDGQEDAFVAPAPPQASGLTFADSQEGKKKVWMSRRT